MTIEVQEGGLDDPQTLALLRTHAEQMVAHSPADHCHFLDPDGLRASDVVFFTAWDGDTLLGCGALKDHGDGTSEVKSMRTDEAHQRRGVAHRLLDRITAEARARGCRRLSLETGSGPAFEAALALYVREGFVDGPPFADYRATDFNRYLHKEL